MNVFSCSITQYIVNSCFIAHTVCIFILTAMLPNAYVVRERLPNECEEVCSYIRNWSYVLVSDLSSSVDLVSSSLTHCFKCF